MVDHPLVVLYSLQNNTLFIFMNFMLCSQIFILKRKKKEKKTFKSSKTARFRVVNLFYLVFLGNQNICKKFSVLYRLFAKFIASLIKEFLAYKKFLRYLSIVYLSKYKHPQICINLFTLLSGVNVKV